MEVKYWIILVIIILVLLLICLGFYFYNEYLKRNIISEKQKFIISPDNNPRIISVWVEDQPTEENSSKCLLYTFPTTYIDSTKTYYVGKPSYNKKQLEILDGVDPIKLNNITCLYPNQILAKSLTFSCPDGKCLDENGNQVDKDSKMIMYKSCDPNENLCSRSNRRSDCDDSKEYPTKDLQDCIGSLGVVNIGGESMEYNGLFNCTSSTKNTQVCELTNDRQQGVLQRASISRNFMKEDTSGYFVKFSNFKDSDEILQVKNNNASIPYYYQSCSSDIPLLKTDKERNDYAKKINQTNNRYMISTSSKSSDIAIMDKNPNLNTNIPSKFGYLWMMLPSFKTNYGSLMNNQFSQRLIYIGDRNDSFIQRIIQLLDDKKYLDLLTLLDNENVMTLSLYNTYDSKKSPELNAYFILTSYEESIINCLNQYEGKTLIQFNNQPFSYQTLTYNLYNLQQTNVIYGN